MRIVFLIGTLLALTGCASRDVTFLYYPNAPHSGTFPRPSQDSTPRRKGNAARYGLKAVHYWDTYADFDRLKVIYNCVPVIGAETMATRLGSKRWPNVPVGQSHRSRLPIRRRGVWRGLGDGRHDRHIEIGDPLEIHHFASDEIAGLVNPENDGAFSGGERARPGRLAIM